MLFDSDRAPLRAVAEIHQLHGVCIGNGGPGVLSHLEKASLGQSTVRGNSGWVVANIQRTGFQTSLQTSWQTPMGFQSPSLT